MGKSFLDQFNDLSHGSMDLKPWSQLSKQRPPTEVTPEELGQWDLQQAQRILDQQDPDDLQEANELAIPDPDNTAEGDGAAVAARKGEPRKKVRLPEKKWDKPKRYSKG
jgi:hypothetical protein